MIIIIIACIVALTICIGFILYKNNQDNLFNEENNYEFGTIPEVLAKFNNFEVYKKYVMPNSFNLIVHDTAFDNETIVDSGEDFDILLDNNCLYYIKQNNVNISFLCYDINTKETKNIEVSDVF